jgi:hypothetical protein
MTAGAEETGVPEIVPVTASIDMPTGKAREMANDEGTGEQLAGTKGVIASP